MTTLTSLESHKVLLTTRENDSDKPDDAFREIIVSCRSLSNYESKSIRSALPQISAAIISASFHIVIGIALSFSAIFIPQAESPDSDLKVTQVESSWIASVIVIVGPIASMGSGVIMDYIGRLNTIKIAAIPAIVGWILIATATNVPMIITGRILTGLGCVAGTSPAVVYITEVARPDMRGSLISSGPTLASLGMVIGYTKGAIFNWRVLSWTAIGYCIVPIILIILFVPESPVWLVNKGRIEDAAASLKYLYKNYPQPEHTNQSLADMHLTTLIKDKEMRLMERMRNSSKPDFANMKKRSKMRGFLKPTGYKPLILLFFLFLIQQFSGIYITLFYAVTFFKDIGSSIDPYTCSILFGVTRFVMSLLNAWLLKRFKRRHLIMTSSIGMAICMGVSGLATYGLKNDIDTPAWIPVVFLLLYVCASMIGLLTIPWTMTAELFPNDIRGIAHSLSYSMANILMFLAVQTYRDLQRFLGSSYALQWFFACISIVGFFYGWLVLPETHGKKLKDIEDYFSGKSSRVSEVTSNGKKHPPSTLKTISEHEVMLKENNA